MKSIRLIKALARAFFGGFLGALTFFLEFTVLDFFLLGPAAIMRNESTNLSTAIILSVVCLGASTGAILSAVFGGREIRGMPKHVVFGVLVGVGIVVVLGLMSAGRLSPPASEVHKAEWLIYGVPIGVTLGGILGSIYSHFRSN